MKSGKLSVNLLKLFIVVDVKKRRKKFPPHIFREKINIPYLDDNNKQHTYDVYLANEENRKHICIIDIHGGSYIFGEHQDNYPFAFEMLKEGFDVVLLDYESNSGKKDILDLINDCASNLRHLYQNLVKYDLDKDKIVLCGDSAGGHLALLLAEAFIDKETASILNLDLPKFDIKTVLLNCPVYDFEHLGEGTLSSSGFKRLLGPKFNDKEHLRKLSPKTYIDKVSIPLFLSTCKRDFIRNESMLLNKDMEGRTGYGFVDIDSDDKNVDHVHNVTKPQLEESKKVNNAMASFLEIYL